MDNNGSYRPINQTHLINELTRGMELVRQLTTQMGPEFSVETIQILQQIVSLYDKALSILRCGANAEPHQLMPRSPSSVIRSSTSSCHQDFKECSLKRKLPCIWNDQVKASPEKGFDGPPDDGYSWRKYGQKEILGAKYPRSYYRCTYRNVHDCRAKKQVQKSDEDPTVFEITYKGNHTCKMFQQSKSAPTTPRKLRLNQELSSEGCQQDYAMSFQGGLPFELSDLLNLDSFPEAELGDYSMPSLEVDTFANEVQYEKWCLDGGIGDIVFGATSSGHQLTES